MGPMGPSLAAHSSGPAFDTRVYSSRSGPYLGPAFATPGSIPGHWVSVPARSSGWPSPHPGLFLATPPATPLSNMPGPPWSPFAIKLLNDLDPDQLNPRRQERDDRDHV